LEAKLKMKRDSNKINTEMSKGQTSENDSQKPFITTEGLPYEITEEGSLGILAMGYVGIMLWREKKYNSTVKSEIGNKSKEK